MAGGMNGSFDAAMAAIPVRQRQSAEPPPRPLCWVAALRDKRNWYSKNCCLAWQPPIDQSGVRQWYNWEGLHGGTAGSDPGIRWRYEVLATCYAVDDWPNTFAVDFTGGPEINVADFGGQFALNAAEFDYYVGSDDGVSPGMNRVVNPGDNSQYGGTWDDNEWLLTIMSYGFIKDRLSDRCDAEPRPDRWGPFFHRYTFALPDLCPDTEPA